MEYVAIAVGALAVMALGFVWFHPAVLGKSWMRGAGLTEEDLKAGNPLIMVAALLMAGVLAYATSRYAGHTEPGMSQFVHGMFHGFMPAIMYVAPVLVSKGLFEKKDLGWILSGTVLGISDYACRRNRVCIDACECGINQHFLEKTGSIIVLVLPVFLSL